MSPLLERTFLITGPSGIDSPIVRMGVDCSIGSKLFLLPAVSVSSNSDIGGGISASDPKILYGFSSECEALAVESIDLDVLEPADTGYGFSDSRLDDSLLKKY